MKNFKEIVSPMPTTLTFVTTHSCTAQCHDCCFDCSPHKRDRISLSEMIETIDVTKKAFQNLEVVVFSGGECFLLGNDLDKAIKHAHEKGLITRVVTNAYWATDMKKTYDRLSMLKKIGLNEVNVSTGDNHQKFVPIENVINVMETCVKLNLTPMAITIEGKPNATFTIKDFLIKAQSSISELNSKEIRVITSSWMSFTKTNNLNGNLSDTPPEIPCSNLFDSITINPHGQLLACCGLTVECNKYLKLGDLRYNDLNSLYDAQFEDLYLLWLYTYGPKYMYRRVCEVKGVKPQMFPHPCAYCIELINSKEEKLIRRLIQEEWSSIICRLEMKKNRTFNI